MGVGAAFGRRTATPCSPLTVSHQSEVAKSMTEANVAEGPEVIIDLQLLRDPSAAVEPVEKHTPSLCHDRIPWGGKLWPGTGKSTKPIPFSS